jgi:3-hydroxyacyl-[acyl-carrier-protein] dehydratase
MLDRITHLEPGVRIRAEKQLRPDEEYLKDHFPKFPVMPGVLMLEALFQSAMWLVRATEDFQHSVVILKEARNIKYADFVGPNQILEVTCELNKFEGDRATVKGQGLVEGTMAVSGRLVLELSNLGDLDPLHKPRDVFTCSEMRKELDRLCAVLQPME